jgi:uncharacterized protein
VAPITLPRSSRPRGASILIAAISGRALARAAAESGLRPLVADFFADADTQALAAQCRKLEGDVASGVRWAGLSRALEALAKEAPSPLLGLVYGSGFEDRPELLTRIAARWPLLGNDAATVKRIKAPESFFGMLARLGIPHPRTQMKRSTKGASWLAKRRGGAGGGHVVPSRLQKDGANVYYQELIEGRSLSALFVANGDDARVLGFSEQWTSPAPRRLWRYGGAVRPVRLAAPAQAKMVAAIERAASAFKIEGLGSADFILRGNEAFLLEINPRPGATLDIFEGGTTPLLSLHLDAVTYGKLPRTGPRLEGAAASAIVFAPRAVIVPRNMVWPAWTADRPQPGERIDKYRPICTVLARAGTRGRARRLVEARISKVLANIQEAEQGKNCGQTDKRDRDASNGAAERQHQGRATGPRLHR